MKIRNPFTRLIIAPLLLSLALNIVAADPKETEPSSEQKEETKSGEEELRINDIKNFDVLVKLNIFDPQRGTPPPKPTPPRNEPPPRPDKIALKGTLVEDDKAFAFWDGTLSEFRTVAELKAEVGEFTVKEVTSVYAVLGLADKDFKIHVGDELEKPVGGQWALISNSGRGGFSSGASLGSSKSSSADDEAGMSDVMKRLLERRKKQMGQ